MLRRINSKHLSARFAFAGALVAIPIAATSFVNVSAAAATKASPIYGPREQPLGTSHAAWLDAWGKFAFGGPAGTNPLRNLENCDSWRQPDPSRVFFLAAGGPGKFATRCNVPAGLPIALTPGGSFAWNTDDQRAAISDELKAVGTAVRKPRLTIDGRVIDVTKHLVETDWSTLTIEAPDFGPLAGKGPVTTKSKGWMVLVKPLSDGAHKIVISDELQRLGPDGKPVLVKGKPAWDISQVTFALNVGGPVRTATPATPATVAATTPPTTLAVAPAAFPAINFPTLTSLAAGPYATTVGQARLRLDVAAGWISRISNSRAVNVAQPNDFTIDIGIWDNPLVADDAVTPKGPVPFPADYAAYLRRFPNVKVDESTVTIAGVSAKRYRLTLTAPTSGARGALTYLYVPVADSRTVPLTIDTTSPINETLYVVQQPNGTPLVIDAVTPKAIDSDAAVAAVVRSITF